MTGKKRRRKFLCTFAVVGAAAGISAGFDVLVTGFVYVIEEVTRSLSRKLALILAFAAAFALLFKEILERFIGIWYHPHHRPLVPDESYWKDLTEAEHWWSYLLCVPIGILTGVAGWVWTHFTWKLLTFLKPENQPALLRRCVPVRIHLAIIGILVGCLGAVAYEVTGMNGVWGTSIGAIPDAIDREFRWEHALLLFVTKFVAFILATAGGGPGGALVPSLITGGLLGLTVARVFDASRSVSAFSATMGMGSMFGSVMHMPLTGVIIIFELTRNRDIMMHVAFTNFIAYNISARLPHGGHSFVHRQLEKDLTWQKMECRDFIETDDQEMQANLALVSFTLRSFLVDDKEMVRICFDSWIEFKKLPESDRWEAEGAELTKDQSEDEESMEDQSEDEELTDEQALVHQMHPEPPHPVREALCDAGCWLGICPTLVGKKPYELSQTNSSQRNNKKEST